MEPAEREKRALQNRKKLCHLDLTGCARLLALPDMSLLGEQLSVVTEGVNKELVLMWSAGGRKHVNAAFL